MTLDSAWADVEAKAAVRWPDATLAGPSVELYAAEPHRRYRARFHGTARGLEQPEAIAFGPDPETALTNLAAVIEGKSDGYERAFRLSAAQARESEAQAALDAAKAEREVIEAIMAAYTRAVVLAVAGR